MKRLYRLLRVQTHSILKNARPSEYFLLNVRSLPEHKHFPSRFAFLGLPLSFHLLEQISVVLSNGYYVGMIGTQLLFTDRQSSLVERQGLAVLALALVEPCQVVEATCCVGMIGTQLLFSDRQSSLQERHGLAVLALALVEHSQVVEAGCRVGVRGSQRLFSDRQGSLVERQGLAVLALPLVEHSQAVEAACCVG